MTLAQTRPTLAAAFFRPFDTDADWWAIRDLLIRTHARAGVDFNWDIRHWDGARVPVNELYRSRIVRRGIGLWEADGRLVGAVHTEDGDDAFLQVDPDYRHIVPAMLAWAEDNLSTRRDGRRLTRTFCWDYDLLRVQALEQRRYECTTDGGWTRIVRLGAWHIPDLPVAEPYRMRTTTQATLYEDADALARLHNAAFARTFHTRDEYMRFATSSPSFRHDLNLVAEAPDGHFAAHVGVTYDEINNYGLLEPVCTDPRDQRHGLARALIFEGMRRLRDLGASKASVQTGDMEPANALYRSCCFTEEYRGHWWELEQ